MSLTSHSPHTPSLRHVLALPHSSLSCDWVGAVTADVPGLYYAFYCRPIFQIVSTHHSAQHSRAQQSTAEQLRLRVCACADVLSPVRPCQLYIATIVSLVSMYYVLYQCKACHAHSSPPAVSTSTISLPVHKSTSARQHSHWVRVFLLVSMVAFAVVPSLHFILIVNTDYPSALTLTPSTIPSAVALAVMKGERC